MIKKVCFLSLICLFAAKSASAWSLSVPAETKILSARLTDCEHFEYKRQNIFDIKLEIKGRKDDTCIISLDLDDSEGQNKNNTRHYSCSVSDFNLEEIKLAFEEATVSIVGLEKNKDDTVILDLFEGFKKNNICR